MPTKRNNEVKEFAIGTKIEYNGKLYEVVEDLFCDNCSIANICTNAEFTNIKKVVGYSIAYYKFVEKPHYSVCKLDKSVYTYYGSPVFKNEADA